MNNRKIQELYRERMAEKNDETNGSKGIFMIVIAIIITLFWIAFFDGQITNDHPIIKMQKIESINISDAPNL